jgi:hypothetical protein
MASFSDDHNLITVVTYGTAETYPAMEVKMKKGWKIKRFIMVYGLAMLILSLWPVDSAMAQPRHFVCMRNGTGNQLNYAVMWCNEYGERCTSWKRFDINPYSTMKHWGPTGISMMYINIHTGGPNGRYDDYAFAGSTNNCEYWSTKDINYNNRGFLRIYDAQ